MNAALLPMFRRSSDARSAMLAICALFLLAGMVGAYASGALASPAAEGAAIYCHGGPAAKDSPGEMVAQCCTLACPMVAAAHAGPGGMAIIGLTDPSGLLFLRRDTVAQPPSKHSAIAGARGPPLSL